jgi:hypothetical protein
LPDLKLKSTQPNLRRHAFCQADIGCGSFTTGAFSPRADECPLLIQ